MIRRDAWREYSRGSLWLLPVVATVVSPSAWERCCRGSMSARARRWRSRGPPTTRATCSSASPARWSPSSRCSSAWPWSPCSCRRRSSRPGCCATSCGDRPTRSCSASSSAPSATAPPGSSRSASPAEPGRRVPAVRGQRRGRAAVPQPRPAGVLRRPPGPLDPGRPRAAGGGARHPGRHHNPADRRGTATDPTTRRARRRRPNLRLRPSRPPRCLAVGGQDAARAHPATPQDRRARRSRHGAGVGVAGREPPTRRPTIRRPTIQPWTRARREPSTPR